MSNTVSIIQKQALNMLVCTYVAMKCISLTHTAHMHIQSYRMHLKSSNGPIDVLVCPEGDDQQPHSPYPSVDGCSQAVTTQLSNTTTSTPKRMLVATREGAVVVTQEDLDVSLSSAADAVGDDLDGLMQSYDCESLEKLDSNTLLPPTDMYSFESLSPPLQDEDFSFALDPTEGIQELFDLV